MIRFPAPSWAIYEVEHELAERRATHQARVAEALQQFQSEPVDALGSVCLTARKLRACLGHHAFPARRIPGSQSRLGRFALRIGRV